MRAHGADLYRWLEDGAHIYVCGDATRMAHDVEEALLDIVTEHGHHNIASAKDVLAQLKKDRRYVRDVY